MKTSSPGFPVIWESIFRLFHFVCSKLLSFVYGSSTTGTPTLKNSILTESASSLANKIRSQKVTSTEVVQAFICRVQETNEVLNCVVDQRFEDALREAKQVDELIQSMQKTTEEIERETPLLGVPFTAEDTLAVKGLLSTGGTWSRRNVRAEEDADVVSWMREAGAIPLACTNVSDPLSACETSNPVFGRTNNPYGTNCSAGGSSGGVACSVASSGCPLGVSVDCGGSLRLSCAFNGVFGHKPSADCVPSTHSVGPLCRSSADLLPTLKVLTKNSKVDLKLDEPVDIKNLRYYFMEDDGGSPFTSAVDTEIKEAIQRAVDHFRNTHKATTERVSLNKMKDALFIWKAKADSAAKVQAKSLNFPSEIVKTFFGSSPYTLLFLLTRLLESILLPDNDSKKKEFNEECSELFFEFQDLLGTNGVFIYPTQPTAAFYHNESLTKGFNVGYAAIFNALGLPATHCPTGLNAQGLPVGFQVVGGMHQDRLTVAVAKEIEKVFGGWRPPPSTGTFTLKKSAFISIDNEKLKVL